MEGLLLLVAYKHHYMYCTQLKLFECKPLELYRALNEPMHCLQCLAEHRLMMTARHLSTAFGISQTCWVAHRAFVEMFGMQYRISVRLRTGSFLPSTFLELIPLSLKMMYYWTHKLKAKHVVLFEGMMATDDWWTTITLTALNMLHIISAVLTEI